MGCGKGGGAGSSCNFVAELRLDALQENEYEQQRAEQIARNRERLMELGLPHLAARAVPVKPTAPVTAAKGLKAKKKSVCAIWSKRFGPRA